MSSVKKNYLYSVSYQILSIIVPLITTPYLSRTLGAEKVGIYAYTNSIVQYFALIAMLGILDYGNRTIASLRTKEERSVLFEEIYLLQLTTSIIALFLYIFYCISRLAIYKSITIIQGLVLLASLLDINWFFFGIEKFRLTVTRNVVLKIISLIFIFLFVRNENDLWKYVLITVGSIVISNCILWFYLKKEVTFTKVEYNVIWKHFKPCLILMLPLLSRSIFVYLDKTMLGIMSGMTETGYYEYSEKIILAATSVLTPLGTVMLPRISSLLSEGKEAVAQRYTSLSMDFVVGLGVAFTFGIMAVSNALVSIFLGSEYLGCEKIVNIMSITIVLVGWTNVIRTQYILPYKKDKVYMIAVFGGAVVDFLINVLLIPTMGAMGASIGWVVAEIVITLTQSIYSARKLPIVLYLRNEIGFVINAVIMYQVVLFVTKSMEISILSLLYGIISGILTYCILTVAYIYIFRDDLKTMLIGYFQKKFKN